MMLQPEFVTRVLSVIANKQQLDVLIKEHKDEFNALKDEIKTLQSLLERCKFIAKYSDLVKDDIKALSVQLTIKQESYNKYMDEIEFFKELVELY